MSTANLSNEGSPFPSDIILPWLKTVLTAPIFFNLDFSQAIYKSFCEFLKCLGIKKKTNLLKFIC